MGFGWPLVDAAFFHNLLQNEGLNYLKRIYGTEQIMREFHKWIDSESGKGGKIGDKSGVKPIPGKSLSQADEDSVGARSVCNSLCLNHRNRKPIITFNPHSLNCGGA